MSLLPLFIAWLITIYIFHVIDNFECLFRAAGWLIASTKLVHQSKGIKREITEVTSSKYLQCWLKNITTHFYIYEYCGGLADIYIKILPGLHIKFEAIRDIRGQ